MKGIKSQLGSFNFGNESDFGNLEIPDESFVKPQQEKVEITKEEFLKQRQQLVDIQKESENKVSKRSQNRLELLIGVGRLYTEVKVENTVFYLRSLKRKEMVQANVHRLDSQNEEQTNLLILALALYDIKVDNESILDSEDTKDKVNLLLELDDAIYLLLIKEYQKMLNKHYSDISALGENSEEITENIKKS